MKKFQVVQSTQYKTFETSNVLNSWSINVNVFENFVGNFFENYLYASLTGTIHPGYLWIEAVEWSIIHNKWFILPRYVSFDSYHEIDTERRGANLMIIADEEFDEIELVFMPFPSVNDTDSDSDSMDADVIIPNDMDEQIEKAKIQQQFEEYEKLEKLEKLGDSNLGKAKIGENDASENFRRRMTEGEISGGRNGRVLGRYLREEDKFSDVLKVSDLNSMELRELMIRQDYVKKYLRHSTRGFSSLSFLPGSNDTVIVAVKTQEMTATFQSKSKTKSKSKSRGKDKSNFKVKKGRRKSGNEEIDELENMLGLEDERKNEKMKKVTYLRDRNVSDLDVGNLEKNSQRRLLGKDKDDFEVMTSHEIHSYLTIFNIFGRILMADVPFPGHKKYEGIVVT